MGKLIALFPLAREKRIFEEKKGNRITPPNAAEDIPVPLQRP